MQSYSRFPTDVNYGPNFGTSAVQTTQSHIIVVFELGYAGILHAAADVVTNVAPTPRCGYLI